MSEFLDLLCYKLTARQLDSYPLVFGFIMSVLEVLIVWLLLRDQDPATHDIDQSGVLELAWLFARNKPDDLLPLLNVRKPKSKRLREAGQQIDWNARPALVNT
jgi:hypothetical protein